MSIVETFHGYIETTQDALLIFEACRRNILPKITRRLLEKERKLVRSGSVFVFDERESGIKRWTDGLVWSPSRIIGNFLIYRELDKTQSKRNNNNSNSKKQQHVPLSSAPYNVEVAKQRTKERQLVGSLSEAYHFRKDGLIKKTISLVLNGNPLHLISYYHPDDVVDHRLRTPSAVPELVNLEISPDLLNIQNFRIPPMIEPEQPPSTYSNDTAYKSAISMPVQYNRSPPSNIPFHPYRLPLEIDQQQQQQQQEKHVLFNNSMHNTLPSPTSTPNTPLPTPSQSNNSSNDRKQQQQQQNPDPKSIYSLLINTNSSDNDDNIPQQQPQQYSHHLMSDNSRVFNPVVQWNAL